MNILQSVTEVFTDISTWIVSAIQQCIPLFYDGQGLTLLGVLSVMGLAISVFFLVMRVIQNFLHFKG